METVRSHRLRALLLGMGSILLMASCIQKEASAIQSKDITFASDRDVKIHATIVVPNQKNMPLVVMAHGFMGDRSGRGNFAPLARQLAAQGIASIRIDFPGSGESEEAFTAYDLANMSQDLTQAITYMKQTYSIDEERIGLVGYSMGGRVAALYLKNSIKAAALWAPAAMDGLSGLAEFMGGMDEVEALYAKASADGKVLVPQGDEPYGECSRKFFAENEVSRPLSAIAAYSGALFIAVAGEDEVISKDTTNAVIHHAKQIEVVNLQGADHAFEAADGSGSQEAREQLVASTASFLVAKLK